MADESKEFIYRCEACRNVLYVSLGAMWLYAKLRCERCGKEKTYRREMPKDNRSSMVSVRV